MTAATKPTIVWSLASLATKYNLVVATDLGCTSAVETDNNVTSGRQTLTTALTNGTTYYVCVTALDGANDARFATNYSPMHLPSTRRRPAPLR